MLPSPLYLSAAQARLASHVTSTFFTRRAACAEQLQFVLISGTKLSPGFLLAEISTIDSYRRSNLKECGGVRSQDTASPIHSTFVSYDIWSGQLAFKSKNYTRRQELWGVFGGSFSVKVGGEVSQIYSMLYQYS
jgi:hypothetical protein